MSSETDILIQQLHRVEKLLSNQKKEENLTPDDLKIFSIAEKYFGEKYFFENNYSRFLKNLPISAISDFILELQKEEGDEDQEKTEDREKNKPKEQEASIPPELESLVAEYQQNQALLNDKEIKSNSKRSVAEQVKIAIAHSKIKELAHANKQRRLEKGEKFQDADKTLISLGSPKSESIYDALDTSYQVIQEVASIYEGFSKLSEQLQNEIISNAVELNIIGISDIDTAIQASALQVESSSLTETDKTNLATIPGGFVSVVYQEIKTQDQKTFVYQTTLNENEQKLIQLEDKLLTKSEAEKTEVSLEIKVITAENEKISLALEEQEKNLSETIEKQTESFKTFTADREKRISQDPDLKDKIELANKNIASIHSNLKANGIEAQLHSPMDDAIELEVAIRHDLPGELRPHSGNVAEKAAALVNNPKTQSSSLSPTAILLYGKGLTPKLLAKARNFAIENPGSSLGKLIKTRKDLFDSVGSNLRKIQNSPLEKEITVVTSGVGKVFSSVSKFFGKFTDKIPGGLGNAFRVIQDPWGAFKSLSGRKAGEYVLRQLSKRIANETLKKTGELLLKNGVSASIKKLAGQAATKLALKLGLQAAASSTGVGVIVAVAIEILSWVWDKTVSIVNKLSVSIYGEKIKARDLLAAPAMGIAGVATFIAGIGTATAAAASSAAVTIGLGVLVGFFFYITSIAVAPLISTLVQLDSTIRTSIATGCASWPTAGEYVLNQGPLGTATHSLNKLQAVDIPAVNNSEFLVAAPGVVIFSGPRGTYGNTAIISAQTENGEISMLYAHMNDVYVQIGQMVDVGNVVGSVGGTGGWTPHIHFEYLGGVEYNSCPAGDIPVPEGCVGATCLYNGQPIITNVTIP